MNNFNPEAQLVLTLARREAVRLKHAFVGTEHVLLGMISLGQGVAIKVLTHLGIKLDELRGEVEKNVAGPKEKPVGNMPFVPRVKKVLALAARESTALKHDYVGTEHILLGLLIEDESAAARVLKKAGVDLQRAREGVLKQLPL